MGYKRIGSCLTIVALLFSLMVVPFTAKADNIVAIFSDSFTRADSSTVGNSWEDNSPTRYSIVSNTLQGGGTIQRPLRRPISEAVQSTQVKLSFHTVSSITGSVHVGTNYNGTYGYVLNASSGGLKIQKYNSSTGGTSDIATTAFTPLANTDYILTFNCVSNGTSSTFTGNIALASDPSTALASVSGSNSDANYQNIGRAFLMNVSLASYMTNFTSSQIVPTLTVTAAVTARSVGVATITGSITGGLTPYVYRWDKSTDPSFTPSEETLVSGQTSSSITDVPPAINQGSYYKLTVTSSDGQSVTTDAVGLGPDDPFTFDRPLVVARPHLSLNLGASSGITGNTYQQAYSVTQNLSDVRINFANTFSIYGGGIPQGEYSTYYTNQITIEAAVLVLNSSGTLIQGPTQITFNGQNSYTLPYTSGVSSDALNISISSGQKLMVRTYVQVPSGGRIPLLEQTTTGGSTTNLKSGATNIDSNDILSTTADFSPGNGQFIYAPVGVYGTLSGSPSVSDFDTHGITLIGDSILEGTTSYGNIIAAASNLPYLNIGRAGEMGSTFSGLGGQVRKSMLGGQPILFDQYGINDIRASSSFASLKAAQLAIWTEFARLGGQRIITTTVTPLSNEIGAQNDYTSTSTQVASSYAATRTSWNDYLRNGGAQADVEALGLEYYNADIAATLESTQNSSIWANDAGTAYTSDGVHPNTAGINAVVAAWQPTILGYMTASFDSTPPTITNVTSDKADGYYKVGEVVDIDVTFSEVVTSTGDVTVTLETGDTDRTCTFSVTSSTTGTCNYTVQAGDTSADLTVASVSGTIADGVGNVMTDFVPATNLATNKAIVVDTTANAPGVTAPSMHEVIRTSTYTATGTCETGATVSIASSSLQSNPTTVTCSSGTFSVLMTFVGGALNTEFTPSFTQTDLAGNVSGATTRLIRYAQQETGGGGGGSIVVITTSPGVSIDIVPVPNAPINPISLPEPSSAMPVFSNTVSSSNFSYLSEDPTILTKLQSVYGATTVTESIYKNQCETNEGKPYYRQCPIGLHLDTFDLFRDDALCEGFIVQQASEKDYRFNDTAPRKEVTAIAVKMKKVDGKNVSLLTQGNYQNIYTDIGHGEASWIQPVAETALEYGIITNTRTLFEPERNVTRAEAYAMMMNSVCMLSHDHESTGKTWQENLYERASTEGLTSKSWLTFEPERPILRQELFLLASKTSDWAERTGGCDPKPQYCFVP